MDTSYETENNMQQEDIEEVTRKIMEALASNRCPTCEKPIEKKRQVGRCVYSENCGHRLYQGKLSRGERS